MDVGRFARFRGRMQTLVTVTLGETPHPRGIDGHHELLPKQAVCVQCLLVLMALLASLGVFFMESPSDKRS
jgi:hypothetical protein